MKRVDTAETIILNDSNVRITVEIGNGMAGSAKLWINNNLQEPTENSAQTIKWDMANGEAKGKTAEIYAEIRDDRPETDITAIRYIIEYGTEASKTEKTQKSDGDNTAVDYRHVINF